MKEIPSNTPRAEIIVRPTDLGGVPTVLLRESLIRSLLDRDIFPVITVQKERLPPSTLLPKKVLVVAPVIFLHGEPTILLRDTYLEALTRNNLIPIIIPGNYPLSLARELIDQTDGLVLTGGSDINPSKYGEFPLKSTEKPDDHRDILELMLTKAFYEARKPVLGICRGTQVMNVSMGGKIIQQVDDHALEVPSYASLSTPQAHHAVHILPGTKFQSLFPDKSEILMTSMHHQAVHGEYLGQGLVVAGVSMKNADGYVEVIEAIDHQWFVGFQPHIEVGEEMDPIFISFAQAVFAVALQTVAV